MKEYPYEDGDTTVLGPQVFVSGDERVINWRGENYYRDDEAERIRRALTNAGYALNPNQGEHPNPESARDWIHTAYPEDHPCYVDPSTLDGNFYDVSKIDGFSNEDFTDLEERRERFKKNAERGRLGFSDWFSEWGDAPPIRQDK